GVGWAAEGGGGIGRRKNAAGEQLGVLIAGRDDVFLGRLRHRQDVLVLVDDGVADYQHAVVLDLLDQVEEVEETAVVAQVRQVVADVRLGGVEMPIEQLGRAERLLVGKVDASAVRLD